MTLRPSRSEVKALDGSPASAHPVLPVVLTVSCIALTLLLLVTR